MGPGAGMRSGGQGGSESASPMSSSDASGVAFVTRSHCPTCGCKDFDVLFDRPFGEPPVREYLEQFYEGNVPVDQIQNDSYTLALCSDCELIFQLHVLGDAGMQLLYESWIDREATLTRKVDGLSKSALSFARQAYQIQGYVSRPPAKTLVLDYGCGWGEWLLMTRGFGYKVAGIEMSESRRDYLRSAGISCYASIEAVLDRVDFVNCSQIMEHVTHPRETLADLASVCNPGAVIQILVPDARGIVGRLRTEHFVTAEGVNRRLNPIAPLEHINGFTPRSLARLGAELGLELVPKTSRDLADTSGVNRASRAFVRTAGRLVANRFLPLRSTALYFRVPG